MNASVCSHRYGAVPEQDVVFEITCRQIGTDAMQVSAQALVEGVEVAQLETLVAYVERSQLPGILG